MVLMEYLAGVATIVVLNRVYEELYWRRQCTKIVHYPPYDRQNIVTRFRPEKVDYGRNV